MRTTLTVTVTVFFLSLFLLSLLLVCSRWHGTNAHRIAVSDEGGLSFDDSGGRTPFAPSLTNPPFSARLPTHQQTPNTSLNSTALLYDDRSPARSTTFQLTQNTQTVDPDSDEFQDFPPDEEETAHDDDSPDETARAPDDSRQATSYSACLPPRVPLPVPHLHFPISFSPPSILNGFLPMYVFVSVRDFQSISQLFLDPSSKKIALKVMFVLLPMQELKVLCALAGLDSSAITNPLCF